MGFWLSQAYGRRYTAGYKAQIPGTKAHVAQKGNAHTSVDIVESLDTKEYRRHELEIWVMSSS